MNEQNTREAAEAAYQIEAERRFRCQVPDSEPLPDFRDAEVPFKSVFMAGFRAGAASVDRAEIADLLTDVRNLHSHPDSNDYNECDKDPCNWCERAIKIIAEMEKGK